MPDETEAKLKAVPLVRSRTDETITCYSNDSWVGSTKWEVELGFGRIPALPPEAKIPDALTVPADVTIIMTFEHAEAFLKALSGHLEKVKARKVSELQETGKSK